MFDQVSSGILLLAEDCHPSLQCLPFLLEPMFDQVFYGILPLVEGCHPS